MKRNTQARETTLRKTTNLKATQTTEAQSQPGGTIGFLEVLEKAIGLSQVLRGHWAQQLPGGAIGRNQCSTHQMKVGQGCIHQKADKKFHKICKSSKRRRDREKIGNENEMKRKENQLARTKEQTSKLESPLRVHLRTQLLVKV